MDSTPPKSASRMVHIPHSINPTPLSTTTTTKSDNLPLRQLLLRSPSPHGKSRSRISDHIEETVVEPTRRRGKIRGAQMGLMSSPSPRNNRRLRKRWEMEMKEDRESVEDVVKPRKRRSKKEKLGVVSSLDPTPPNESRCVDRIGLVFFDLIMWKDTAKSSLWFGFGCLFFSSSAFSKEIDFSIFSAISQLGLLMLGTSFFSTSILQRKRAERFKFELKDDDMLRAGRLLLPPLNLAISKIRQIFSGEPSTTLKVFPFLLLGAEYGHLITIWRLCALGFFISFTAPRIYCCYSTKLNHKVDNIKDLLIEAWRGSSHKKLLAASAATIFWNLSSVKTRILTAFIALVILRCYSQQYLQLQLVAAKVKGNQPKEEEKLAVMVSKVRRKEEEETLVVIEETSPELTNGK